MKFPVEWLICPLISSDVLPGSWKDLKHFFPPGTDIDHEDLSRVHYKFFLVTIHLFSIPPGCDLCYTTINFRWDKFDFRKIFGRKSCSAGMILKPISTTLDHMHVMKDITGSDMCPTDLENEKKIHSFFIAPRIGFDFWLIQWSKHKKNDQRINEQ